MRGLLLRHVEKMAAEWPREFSTVKVKRPEHDRQSTRQLGLHKEVDNVSRATDIVFLVLRMVRLWKNKCRVHPLILCCTIILMN